MRVVVTLLAVSPTVPTRGSAAIAASSPPSTPQVTSPRRHAEGLRLSSRRNVTHSKVQPGDHLQTPDCESLPVLHLFSTDLQAQRGELLERPVVAPFDV